MAIIDGLYSGELGLYKNFFQPVMKLVRKERIEGRIKRKYDTPRTPYRRLLELGELSEETKKRLEALYRELNPAELKRNIEAKLEALIRVYEQKNKSPQVIPQKKQVPRFGKVFHDRSG